LGEWFDQIQIDHISNVDFKVTSDFDETMFEEIIDDDQTKLILQEEQKCVSKLKDHGFDELIRQEGPRQVMNLIVVDQTKKTLGVPSSKEDDYVDLIKWISHEK
jgi:hypothetical protein